MSLILGIDSSTQSISAVIYNTANQKITHEASFNFESSLPAYQTNAGSVTNENNEYLASPLMWLDGLELLLAELQAQSAPLDKIVAISGAAQQHATVYLNDKFPNTVAALNPASSLSAQIKPTLSRELSPIWMDNTTQTECAEITNALGRDYMIKTTGSVSTPRFSGAQIRKFSKQQPVAYQDTATIHMCSSFLASVLSGKDAPLDHSDASGMNLLNLRTLQWDSPLLHATAHDLRDKLPPLCPTQTIIGNISPYFTEKYGFSPDAQITAWAGDNPASLVGMNAHLAGRTVLSLGTSYTLFASMEEPSTDPNGYGHVFCNPFGGYMALTCFQNGALTNEHLRQFFDLTWEEFDTIASLPTPAEPTLDNPFLLDEITPLTPANPKIKDPQGASPELIKEVLVSTFSNIKNTCQWIGQGSDTIHVTGGASQSSGLRDTIAAVFGKKVATFETGSAPSLGAAITAAATINKSS